MAAELGLVMQIRGDERNYISYYIDDEYFYIYFSHFPAKEGSWIKWMR